MAEKIISIDNDEQLSGLFGQLDGNLSDIQKTYNVSIVNRDGAIKIIGDEVNISDAEIAVMSLLKINRDGQ